MNHATRSQAMTQCQSRSLSFRSYGTEGNAHTHDHVQIVLPIQGELEIEVGGRAGRLDLLRGIFIAPGIRHSQAAEGLNRFLILDCEFSHIGDEGVARLSKRSFLDISDAARRLIQFIDLSSRAGKISSSLSMHSFHQIERSAGDNWPVSRMAQLSGWSPSRIHALFQSELQTTPQNWLTEVRLRDAQHILVNTNRPISEIALQLGYSDQSAFTRAMRRKTMRTPAEYRRLYQQ
jgi:AraC-like DNA-binding protein